MLKRLFSPVGFRRRIFSIVVGLGLLSLLAVNFIAYQHARAFGHYAPAGVTTPPPEKLSLGGKINVLVNGVTLPRPENHRTPNDLGLEFETRRFPGARGATVAAWFIPCADARGVVALFHGYGGSKDSLLDLAAQFREWRWATLLVDFHGNGDSSGNDVSVGWHEAEDVAAALSAARSFAGKRPVILYGSSMGAVAVLRAVHALGAKPDALILECPFDRLVTTVGRRFSAMNLPEFPLAQLLVFWGGVRQSFDGFQHNPVEYARLVTCPVLLLHGELDPRVSVEEVRSIFDHLAGPKRLEIFPGVGHESYFAVRREDWRRLVMEFVGGISP